MGFEIRPCFIILEATYLCNLILFSYPLQLCRIESKDIQKGSHQAKLKAIFL